MSEPPMTTIASGFCVCEPMPFESAAGSEPEHRHERRHQHRAEAASRPPRAPPRSIDRALDVAEPLEVGDDEDARPGWRCRRSR